MPLPAARPPLQNSNGLLFSPLQEPPDWSKLSDEELIAAINEHHPAYGGTQSRAIVHHARFAGSALLEMKRRCQHGDWTAWLKANFDGSPETANLYMRIARKWDVIVAHGLDNIPDWTLRDLRWFLAEPRPLQEPKPKPPELDYPEEEDEEPERDKPEEAPPSNTRQYQLHLEANQMEEFLDMVRHLKKFFDVSNLNDAIFRAVQRCHDEIRHG
jgi:hypothetical protein